MSNGYKLNIEPPLRDVVFSWGTSRERCNETSLPSTSTMRKSVEIVLTDMALIGLQRVSKRMCLRNSIDILNHTSSFTMSNFHIQNRNDEG